MTSSDRLLMPELKYRFLAWAQGILEKKHIHMQQIIYQFQSKNATTATVFVQRYILYTVLSSITFNQRWGTV